MTHFNWEIGCYKPGRSPGLWKWYIYRLRRTEGLAVKEYLDRNGHWTEDSGKLHYLWGKDQARKFALQHAGEEVTHA